MSQQTWIRLTGRENEIQPNPVTRPVLGSTTGTFPEDANSNLTLPVCLAEQHSFH